MEDWNTVRQAQYSICLRDPIEYLEVMSEYIDNLLSLDRFLASILLGTGC